MHVFPSYLLEERGILFVFDGKETEKYFWDQTAEDEIRLSLVKYDELFLQDALICQLLYVLQNSLKLYHSKSVAIVNKFFFSLFVSDMKNSIFFIHIQVVNSINHKQYSQMKRIK